MLDDGEYQRIIDGNKTIYGVIDYFSFSYRHAVDELLKQGNSLKGEDTKL
jgi:hypothetical protein